MKKSKFTEEQIIAILRENESGKSMSDICRDHKISSYTFYKWRKKFSGMDVAEAKRMRQLEAENAKLKRAVADLTLDNIILKDALGKK